MSVDKYPSIFSPQMVTIVPREYVPRARDPLGQYQEDETLVGTWCIFFSIVYFFSNNR